MGVSPSGRRSPWSAARIPKASEESTRAGDERAAAAGIVRKCPIGSDDFDERVFAVVQEIADSVVGCVPPPPSRVSNDHPIMVAFGKLDTNSSSTLAKP